ncbi:MAG: glycoside hydrolase family 2 [Hydrotalea flava]|uniref:glycoside hydrolase family 2 protein n=1 Tax=unclassified Hydrotalea TaxID=2643788 RepID=UPI00257F153E|nr:MULTISPECIES: glycoside hydrolase family 2 TIM barrel-domain containing protein [unclassified Hydrotalea]MBY0348827.1 glycoside hydrolase family 2 [Hydrotalea flava]
MMLALVVQAQWLVANVAGRNTQSLNGSWAVIVDPFNVGESNWKPIWKDQHATGAHDFFEYAFDNTITLQVPGDWNSQRNDLVYYEGTVWYKKTFQYQPQPGQRSFLCFGGANYIADVYCNGQKAGSHEGGFTPFQFDVTHLLKAGENEVIVRVNNQRRADAIPALNYDWWNYGGITRDVDLVTTPGNYIQDYFIQLQKNDTSHIAGWVQVAGSNGLQKVSIHIPDLHIHYTTQTNAAGRANISIAAHPALWSPEHPHLYTVQIATATDTVVEAIGFRTIAVKGTEIVLNEQPIFLRGINIHEQIPQRAGRAYSETDAAMLLGWAKELGCNFVRLTHYPHNEHMVRMADKMGILLWEEIPLWQGIQFSNPVILAKANRLLDEMIERDKNRSAIILWSLSNETTSSESRDTTLTAMAAHARALDPTRLITSAFNHVAYKGNTVTIDDSLSKVLDVVGVNEYIGWYTPWPAPPNNMVWKNPFNKPLIMSEFGGEALYGHHGSKDTASSWSEEYQEQLYKDQVAMFKNIPFLCGTTPWVLADFRSPSRLQPVYQQGWNRKGLLSDKGYKKKAWYIMRVFYEEKGQNNFN